MTPPCVWLSGAVPELAELHQYGWSEVDLRFMVARIAERVLADGWGLTHGSHPTYLPIIEQVARGFVEARPRVRIIASRQRIAPDDEPRFRERHRYAEVELTPLGPTPERSRTVMRERLAACCDAVVCIGGKLHSKDGKRPGVEEEIEIALDHRRPTFLIGGFGGFTQHYFRDRIQGAELRLHNPLTAEQNRELAESQEPARALRILMEGLRHVRVAHPGGQP